MNARLLLALWVLCSSTLFAQPSSEVDVKVEIGVPHEKISFSKKQYYPRKGKVISLKYVLRNGFIIQKFNDSTLKEEYRGELLIEDRFSLHDVIDFNGHLIVIYSTHRIKDGYHQVYYREVDTDKAQWKGEAVQLLQTSGNLESRTTKIGGTQSSFDIKLSSDNSKLLVTYLNAHEKIRGQKNVDKAGVYVLDRDLKVIGSGEISMPYVEAKINIISTAVDSEGTAYFFTEVFDDDNSSSKYHIEIFEKKIGRSEFSVIPTELDSILIQDVSMAESPDGNLLWVGFYQIDEKSYDGGIFHYSPSRNLDSAHIRMNKLNGYGSLTPKLYIRNLHFNNNDELIILAERYERIWDEKVTTFLYQDIIALKMDKNGNMDWKKVLSKNQMGYRGQGSLSFSYHVAHDTFFLCYLDKDDSYKHGTYRDLKGYTGDLKAYVLDANTGEYVKLTILNTGNLFGTKGEQIIPVEFTPISDNEIIFEANRNRKEEFLVKVTIQ